MFNRISFVLALCLIATYFNEFSAARKVTIEIRDGKILGRRLHSFSGKKFYSFQKIPYAKPPLGDLRFKPPENPEQWHDNVLDASGSNNIRCLQSSLTKNSGTEDCLYLNVFTPQLPDDKHNFTYPVLVFTHGGAFIHESSAPSLFGPHFLINEDIVIVTLNYRLGAFGFLSTGDEIIPGNAGLKDQLLAIKWVNENIEYFGGDPYQITIAGQSAGAALTSYQLLRTESEGLFRAAIIQSASALTPFVLQRNPKVIAEKIVDTLANSSGGAIRDSQDIFDFLQNVTANDLDAAAGIVHVWASNMLQNDSRTFAPVIEKQHEGAFLTKNMYEQLKSGDFIKVPLLAGFNSLEALGRAKNLKKFKSEMNLYDQHLDWLVPDDMKIKDDAKRKEMGAKIREIYTGGAPLQENLLSAIEYISDHRYTRSVRKFAELYSKSSPVYFYQFSYDGKMGNVNHTIDGKTGVAHHEECNYLWHTRKGKFDNGKFSDFPESDLTTLKRITKMWSNFVKYLHPTPDSDDDSELLQNITWPIFSNDFAYLDIDESLTVKNKPKDKSFAALQSLYDSLNYDNFDTW